MCAPLRDSHVAEAFSPQRVAERVRLLGFTVDQPDSSLAGQAAEQVHQVIVIRMSGEAGEVDDVGPLIPLLAVEAYRGAALQEPATRRVRRLVIDQRDSAARIVNVQLE